MNVDRIAATYGNFLGKMPGFRHLTSKSREMEKEPKPTAASIPADIPRDQRMKIVRGRISSGFYNSSAVNEILSDRLSGVFDQLA